MKQIKVVTKIIKHFKKHEETSILNIKHWEKGMMLIPKLSIENYDYIKSFYPKTKSGNIPVKTLEKLHDHGGTIIGAYVLLKIKLKKEKR